MRDFWIGVILGLIFFNWNAHATKYGQIQLWDGTTVATVDSASEALNVKITPDSLKIFSNDTLEVNMRTNDTLSVILTENPTFTTVNKFGECTDADASAETDIWDGANSTDGIKTWIAPTTARVHNIRSSSATDDSGSTGAWQVVVKGLKSWDSTEVSETVVLNGTANVATVNSYVIIHRMYVSRSGDTINTGKIIAKAATDSTTTAMIMPTKGQTLMAIYGVPSSKTAHMNSYYASILRSSTATGELSLLVNEFPNLNIKPFVHKHENSLVAGGSSYVSHRYDPHFVLQGPCIIKLHIESNTNNTIVSGGFDLELYNK